MQRPELASADSVRAAHRIKWGLIGRVSCPICSGYAWAPETQPRVLRSGNVHHPSCEVVRKVDALIRDG